MKITIAAIGRVRGGPEADLIADYRQRFERSGRGIGLTALDIIEIDPKKPGMEAEGEALLARLSSHAPICCLDERGATMSSPEFAAMLADWRDQGGLTPAFIIGGADGLSKDVRRTAGRSLSFGRMVWPHLLVRVMLTEQLYRAASILAGSPYHRT